MAAAEREGRPGMGALVLLAEDDFELRRLLEQELAEDGHEVISVADGAALFDHVFDGVLGAARMPDVIVSDVRMPGFDGLAVVRHMRTANANVPVVLITAFPSEETRQGARDLGAVMLAKPFDVDELRRQVTALVSRRRRTAST